MAALTPEDLTPPPAAPELHICIAGAFGSDVTGSLLTKDGEVLWSHLSSSVSWLRRDLTTGFAHRAAALRERYGDATDEHVAALAEHAPGAMPVWLQRANLRWAESQTDGGDAA